MLMVDGFATFFRVLVLAVGILTVLPSYRFLRAGRRGNRRVPRAAAVSPSSGQCLMAAANDLIMIFIGLEISSIASYVLAGLPARRQARQRSRAEVLPAGLVRHGVLPVRRGARSTAPPARRT